MRDLLTFLGSGSVVGAVAWAAYRAWLAWLALRKTKPEDRPKILRAMKGRNDTPDKPG